MRFFLFFFAQRKYFLTWLIYMHMIKEVKENYSSSLTGVDSLFIIYPSLSTKSPDSSHGHNF